VPAKLFTGEGDGLFRSPASLDDKFRAAVKSATPPPALGTG
jgi:hypothetical protein